MKKIEAKIIADSISPQGHRIVTFHLTFPRHILAELNTHRMFSRNSASSRAIPFKRMVQMVEEDPFIPIAWQKDHSGMQGKEYFTDVPSEEVQSLIGEWLESKEQAVERAKVMAGFGITKQIVNRLLEPFMWHENLVTTTDFENFFVQRCPDYFINGASYRSKKDACRIEPEKDTPALHDTVGWLMIDRSPAEIHMQALAEAMWDAYNESTPAQLKAGEWHLPFGDNIDVKVLEDLNKDKWHSFPMDGSGGQEHINRMTQLNMDLLTESRVKIASARCARTSYNNFDGSSDPVKDIKLAEGLQADRHRSPLEHAAKCPTEYEYYSNVKGKVQSAENLQSCICKESNHESC